MTPKDKDGKQQLIKMEDTDNYKNNDLGLKYLNEHGKLKLVEINDVHTKYTDKDISDTFLPFLKGWFRKGLFNMICKQ